MSSFEYTDEHGRRLTISPNADSPRPSLKVTTRSGRTTIPVYVPLDQVEEVIAGIRDMARQSAYATAYHQPNRFPGDSAAMRAAAISGVRRSADDEAAVALIRRAAEEAGA
ncbi:hypothetical protein [Streptomyces sp. NPDC054849]